MKTLNTASLVLETQDEFCADPQKNNYVVYETHILRSSQGKTLHLNLTKIA